MSYPSLANRYSYFNYKKCISQRPLSFVILGLLYGLGLLPIGLNYVSLLSLSIYFSFLLNSSSLKRTAETSFVFFFISYLISLPWLAQSFINAIDGSNWAFPAGLVGMLIAVLSISLISTISMLLSLLINLYFSNLVLRALGISFMWMLSEWVRSNVLGGIPLVYMVHLLGDSIYLIQILSNIGFYSYTMLSVFILVLISQKGLPRKSGVIVAVMIFVYGYTAVEIISKPEHDKTIKIRLVSLHISKDDLKKEGKKKAIVDRYIKLSKKNIIEGNEPDIFIWPESASPLLLSSSNEQEKNRQYISSFLNVNQKLITGGRHYDISDDGSSYINYAGMFLIDEYGELLDTFNKKHLVQWGEYVPYREYFPKVFSSAFGRFDYLPSDNDRSLKIFKDLEITPMICVESQYGGIAESKHSNKIFNIVIGNKLWLEGSFEKDQYLTALKFRAVESGRPLVSVSNKGYLAFIDKFGRIKKSSFNDRPEVLDGEIHY